MPTKSFFSRKLVLPIAAGIATLSIIAAFSQTVPTNKAKLAMPADVRAAYARFRAANFHLSHTANPSGNGATTPKATQLKSAKVRPHVVASPPTATPLYTFPGGAGGDTSFGGLVEGSDGNLYGATFFGGDNGTGIVYQITPDGVFKTLASLESSAFGTFVYTPPVEGLNPDGTRNGTFYITEHSGGITDSNNPGGYGAIDKLVPDNASPTGYTLSTLYQFSNGAGGGSPTGALIPGRNPDGTFDGFYYGTTNSGGNSDSNYPVGYGTVFKITSAGVESQVGAFQPAPGGQTGPNVGGFSPRAGLVQGRNLDGTYQDAFYGTTHDGGVNGVGAVFRINRAGTFKTLYEFLDDANGATPADSPLVETTDGAVVGTTYAGGSLNYGVAYKISDPNGAGTFSKITELTSDDVSQYSGLIQATDGTLYGTGNTSGVSHFGTVYSIVADAASPTGFSPSTVFSFPSLESGFHPTAPVIQAANGDLYGTTYRGGANSGKGTIFRLNVTSNTQPTAPAPVILPPAIYTNKGDGTSTVTINGSNFKAGFTVFIGNVATGTTISVATPIDPAGKKIIVNVSALLPGGPHTVRVTNPDGQSASTTLNTVYGPSISKAVYIVGADRSNAFVFIAGDHFVNGCTSTIDGVATTVGYTDAQDLVDSFTTLLTPGKHTIVVTNPDGQSATTTINTLGRPGIIDSEAALEITDKSGTNYLLVSGYNFAPTGYNGSGIAVTIDVEDTNGFPVPVILQRPINKPTDPTVAQTIFVALDASGTTGPYTVGVVNSDNQESEKVSFEVYPVDASQFGVAFDPSLLAGALASHIAHATASGSYSLVEQLTGTAKSVSTTHPAGSAATVHAAITPHDESGPQIVGDVEYIVNPIRSYDGQGYTSTLKIHGTNLVRGGSLSVSNTLVGTSLDSTLLGDQSSGTEIDVNVSKELPAGDHDIIVTNPDGQGYRVVLSIGASSPTQVFLGDPSFANTAIAMSANGPGSTVTALITQDGAGLISQDGGGLISQDGGGIVATGGGNFISHNGSALISQDGGGLLVKNNVISNDGGSVISNDGGSLISQDGGGIVASGGGNLHSLNLSSIRPRVDDGFFPVTATIAAVASKPGVTGSLRLTPTFTQLLGVRPNAASAALPGGALSFKLTKHDAGPKRGAGASNYVVGLKFPDGTSYTLLQMRFIPGMPDTITYQAPGVTVTPIVGGAPVSTFPVPVLTSISPGVAAPGSPSITLAVAGALFTPSTVVNWNGQPLVTKVQSGSAATATVPASLLASKGAARVTVSNPAPGGGTSAPQQFVIGVLQTLHTFPAGPQMIAVPEDYSLAGISGTLSDTTHPLFGWSPGTGPYFNTSLLTPGNGYWVRFTQPTNLYDTGVPTPQTQPFSVTLAPGWNMIGDPFQSSVSLSGIHVQIDKGTGTFAQAVHAGVVSGTLFTYPAGASSYQAVRAGESLSPYAGYWIYAFQPCTLQMTSR